MKHQKSMLYALEIIALAIKDDDKEALRSYWEDCNNLVCEALENSEEFSTVVEKPKRVFQEVAEGE